MVVLQGICSLFVQSIMAQNSPNWSEHIAPIIYKNCSPCHVAGGIAPIPMTNYSETKLIGESIVKAIETKYMPPFPANLEKRRYAHEMALSPEEISAIKRWHEGNYPLGDTTLEPSKPKLKTGSDLAKVDASFRMTPYLVNTNNDEYRCFAIPLTLSEDMMIKGMEVVPGNRRVVHHVLVFQDTSSIPLSLDNATSEPGYVAFGSTGSPTSELIGVYVPGQSPFIYPLDFASRLKKKGTIILQIHYPPGIRNIWDSTKVNFTMEKVLNQREVFIASPLNFSKSLVNGPLYIPANTRKLFFNEFELPAKLSLLAVAPHMHLLGESMQVNLIDGIDTSTIVDIPKWDFHWQMSYMFRNPIVGSRNSKLWAKAWYNNTTSNKYNPNTPPIDVRAGEGTSDEMFLVYFWYTLYRQGDESLQLDTTPLKSLVIEENKFSELVVYPNPFNDFLKFSNISGPTKLSLMDNAGKLIKEYSMEDSTKPIDLSELKKGLYYIRIENSKINTVRIVFKGN